ncbi:Calcineurin-like phosphoesterase [Candidatus Tiddalikarchaeum anstoanum]|nr:Calcineurin-like phosphoesterase [Candidatus Tiddalikarchaeum anstoanum]
MSAAVDKAKLAEAIILIDKIIDEKTKLLDVLTGEEDTKVKLSKVLETNESLKDSYSSIISLKSSFTGVAKIESLLDPVGSLVKEQNSEAGLIEEPPAPLVSHEEKKSTEEAIIKPSSTLPSSEDIKIKELKKLLIEHVDESDLTAKFLKVLESIIDSYSELKLSELSGVDKLKFSLPYIKTIKSAVEAPDEHNIKLLPDIKIILSEVGKQLKMEESSITLIIYVDKLKEKLSKKPEEAPSPSSELKRSLLEIDSDMKAKLQIILDGKTLPIHEKLESTPEYDILKDTKGLKLINELYTKAKVNRTISFDEAISWALKKTNYKDNILHINSGKYIIIADTHSQFEPCLSILNNYWDKVDSFIFLGDYETTAIPLIRLKSANPDKIILLRGNHDGEIGGTEFFNDFSVACILFNKYLLTHAGTPIFKNEKGTEKLDQNKLISETFDFLTLKRLEIIADIKDPKKWAVNDNSKCYYQLVWNDPTNTPKGEIKVNIRGDNIYCFNEQALDYFFNKIFKENNNIKLRCLIRGHETSSAYLMLDNKLLNLNAKGVEEPLFAVADSSNDDIEIRQVKHDLSDTFIQKIKPDEFKEHISAETKFVDMDSIDWLNHDINIAQNNRLTRFTKQFIDWEDLLDHIQAFIQKLIKEKPDLKIPTSFNQLLLDADSIETPTGHYVDIASGEFVIVGDTHGEVDKTLNILNHFWKTSNFIFLGDYVDRGYASIQNLALLLLLKLNFPEKITLLRGNHEDPDVYGDTAQFADSAFLSQINEFNNIVSEKIDIANINNIFEKKLPYFGILYKTYFLVHAGVPIYKRKDDDKINGDETIPALIQPDFDITKLRNQLRTFDHSDEQATYVWNLFWNDPSGSLDDSNTYAYYYSKRGFLFSKACLEFSFKQLSKSLFGKSNQLARLIRAHQYEATAENIEKFEGKIISLFCAGYGINSSGEFTHDIIFMHEKGYDPSSKNITFYGIRPSDNKITNTPIIHLKNLDNTKEEVNIKELLKKFPLSSTTTFYPVDVEIVIDALLDLKPFVQEIKKTRLTKKKL